MRTVRATRRRAATLVEVVVSTILVGVVLVAALDSVGSAVRSLREASRSADAWALAELLLAEAVGQPYRDPDGGTTFGLEPGESLAAGRLGYDDVDDYDGRADSPPVLRDGTPVAGFAGWTASFSVGYADAAPAGAAVATVATDQGLKLVRANLVDPSGKAYTLSALRSSRGPIDQPQAVAATVVSHARVTIAAGGADALRLGATPPNSPAGP